MSKFQNLKRRSKWDRSWFFFVFHYPLYIYFCGLQSKYVNGLSDGNWEKEGARDSEWVSKRERERKKGKFKNWFIGFTQTFSLTLLFVDWI